jgi:hypothetical protein
MTSHELRDRERDRTNELRDRERDRTNEHTRTRTHTHTDHRPLMSLHTYIEV